MMVKIKKYTSVPEYWRNVMMKYCGKRIEVQNSVAASYKYQIYDSEYDKYWYFKERDIDGDDWIDHIQNMGFANDIAQSN